MSTVCYSVGNAEIAYCLFMAQTRYDAAVEIRLDTCTLSEDEVRELFGCSRSSALVATCHTSDEVSREEAVELLSAAIISGADYVDIDTQWPESSRKWLASLAMNHGCRTIFSLHDYDGTPSVQRLKQIGEDALCEGADIIKIVTTARRPADCAAVLSLYKHFEAGRLIAFAMGPLGVETRFASFSAGAPFFFVSPNRGGKTASGQPCVFDFVDKDRILLKGTPEVPCSKSFAQRAILLAALAEGTTTLYGITLCSDTQAALGVARSLGAELSLEGTTLTITGHQNIPVKGLTVKDNHLFVGESGLLARLCIPLAGLSKEPVTIDGCGTLLNRKIDEHKTALRRFGLQVDYTDSHFLPVTVSGLLHSAVATLKGDKGSQMISGLLLALSQCEGESALHVQNITSQPYIELTTYVASFFGLDKYEIDEPEDDESIETYYIPSPQQIVPVKGVEVEKDWSAAAMLMVAGAMFGDITLKGLDNFSNQADAAILDFMEGLHIDMVCSTKTKEINVRKSLLNAFYYDITDTPDLFAPLFVLALRCDGESIISGIHRLVNKESNRARTFAQEFRKLGAQVSIEGDEISIWGHEDCMFSGRAKCSSHGDHRLGMALCLANLMCRKPLKIDDLDCIGKSFPGFLETLSKLKC